jgi:hypothetical protein
MIDARLIVALIIALAGALMIVAVASKAFKKNGALRLVFGILGVVLVLHAVVSVGGQLDWWQLPSGVSGFFLSTAVPQGTVINQPAYGGGSVTTYQPTATYTTKDKYATTTVSGTSYYKVNSLPATTTAQTNVNNGDNLVYWVSNTTYYVRPAFKTAGSGVTPIQAEAFANGTGTVTLYDLIGRVGAGATSSNVSIGANDIANIEVTYQGTAKQSEAPFGGLFVVEYNSSIASLTCEGDALTDVNPYHLTYTTSATTHTYKAFPFTSALDDGTASIKRITCQFRNGASAVGAGAYYTAKFIPANYYITNAGDIVLDVEQFANDATTRTGLGTASTTGYWGA